MHACDLASLVGIGCDEVHQLLEFDYSVSVAVKFF